MLKECLASILQQTFGDFEVIIGNDYVKDSLSTKVIGTNDKRIRIVNYPQNLGEVGNMNALLEMSRGRYFTWLADDDLYLPTFLESVHASLLEHEFLPCVFTAYLPGSTLPEKIDNSTPNAQLLKGSEFLQRYLKKDLKTIGCYGVFETAFIKQLGGIEKLGKGFSPYADNLLAIRASLLAKVIFIDSPLVFFRVHEDSISNSCPDIDAYQSAQDEAFGKCVAIFGDTTLKDDFHQNLNFLLQWFLTDYFSVVERSGSMHLGKLLSYVMTMLKRAMSLGEYRYEMAIFTLRNTAALISTSLTLRWGRDDRVSQ